MSTDDLLKLNDQLMNAPAGVLVAAFAIAIGYVLKAAAFFPNNRIPLVIIAITSVAFPVLEYCAFAQKHADGMAYWIPRNVLIGFIIGFLAWAFHNQILSRWIDPKFFDSSDQTTPPKTDKRPE